MLSASLASILLLSPRTTIPQRIVEGARNLVGKGIVYDPAYVRIRYPMGDVPADQGVCTDVVVRALRHAGFDLQRLIHEDMKRAWRAYPRYSGHTRPDPNIDHRRVPNQRVFFRRHGRVLTTEVSARTRGQWQPGDFVTWKLDNGRDHIGVLTDRRNAKGWPLVIHHLGPLVEEDVLTAWRITGHYRFPK